MIHSIKAKLSGLRHKGYITDAEYDRLKNAIDNEQKWIPSDKELPKEGEDVLACFYNGDGNYKIMVSKRFDYNYWNGVGRTADMVAWMPLPSPWKGEQE